MSETATQDQLEEAVARAINPAPWAEWGYALPDREAQRASALATARHAIAAHLAALEAAGLIVVPIEPDERMLETGANRWNTHHPGLNETYPNERATYRAMIAAARKEPGPVLRSDLDLDEVRRVLLTSGGRIQKGPLP